VSRPPLGGLKAAFRDCRPTSLPGVEEAAEATVCTA
jgi:hypothetical protein